jgi:Fe-S cluster biogenesis protein NfuA
VHFEQLKEQVVQGVCKACISSQAPNQQWVEERALVEIYEACEQISDVYDLGEFSEKVSPSGMQVPSHDTGLVRSIRRGS